MMPNLLGRLVSILGKRAFVSFGVVTFLVAALLATVNITSRYALKLYVEDQLRRIPWDLTIYESGGGKVAGELPGQLRSVQGVQRVESLAFLRAIFPQSGEVAFQVDGKPLSTPWLCVLAATDLDLLPPELHLALRNSGLASATTGTDNNAAILGLVGPERAMGKAFFALQGARDFAIQVQVAKQKRTVFDTPVRGVIRLERDELNRWLMDQTGSIAFVPYIGTILLMPYRNEMLTRFDSVASGLVPPELIGQGEAAYGHVQEAEYFPEVLYLGRADRASLISAWDIGNSLDQMRGLRNRVQDAIKSAGSSAVVDSTTLVLLDRINSIARLIGVLTLLIALPLLWIGWVLAGNLSGLLMLNERRKLGLMRLRGVPGHLMGRSLLLVIAAGGFLGGLLGLVTGSVLPLWIYEHGHLPTGVLAERRQLLLFLLFLVITLVLALLVSRRLVRYATTISPLEASGRVAASEALHVEVRFGFLQLLALVLGAYTLAGWVFGFSLSSQLPRFRVADQVLDFVGLPLFLYGIASLLVSRRKWIQGLLSPIIRPLGGALGSLALRHVAVKPHRTIGFLLIVAMVASVCLYPTVTSRSFQDKVERGARVQMGTEWQFTFNSPDLMVPGQQEKGLANQLAALRPGIERTVAGLSRVPGVRSVTYMVETILPNFYLPGYGFRGVPLYLLGDLGAYQKTVYSEPELGVSDEFENVIGQLKSGAVAVSPPVADFWRLSPGTTVLLGMDDQRRTILAPTSGILAFLPGTPPRTVTDRQGYVQARIDYLNYLFSSNAYLVSDIANSHLASLQVLIPRVIVLVQVEPGVPLSSIQSALAGSLPVAPLEVHNLTQEIGKAGSDMFISLAMENMRIYLLGGLLLALIAILAVALANYAEDRRTLALLRIRGASPSHIWRFLVALLLSPALLGLVLGGLVALVAGYGLTNYVWKLRELKTVVQLLPTHLVVSELTAAIVVLLLFLLGGVASLFSLWVFRRTARENIQEG